MQGQCSEWNLSIGSPLLFRKTNLCKESNWPVKQRNIIESQAGIPFIGILQ
ncbi:hypothetical protein ACHAWO_011518 [Cyclotella atomus]|uniref:Uncharacterized protein n=1 Tax=Cyclotella atomus TaxID=382360 RepID=A0ABD3NB82_9STRA